jgi:hypothetical protein
MKSRQKITNFRRAVGAIIAIVFIAAATAQAQVPPDIAAQLRAIGNGVCVPETAKIYKPLQQKAPYSGRDGGSGYSFRAGSENDHGCFRA